MCMSFNTSLDRDYAEIFSALQANILVSKQGVAQVADFGPCCVGGFPKHNYCSSSGSAVVAVHRVGKLLKFSCRMSLAERGKSHGRVTYIPLG